MTESYPEINPSLFEEAQTIELELAITAQTDRFVKAKSMIERRQGPMVSLEEQTLGEFLGSSRTGFMRSETGEGMSISLSGEVSVVDISGDEPGEPVTVSLEELSAAQQAQALADMEESSNLLVGYVVGYQAHASQQLADIYGDSPIALEKSWELTWKKLRDTVRSMGGGNLADIADFFDELVELQYTQTFDPSSEFRGPQARNEVSTRMFYTVMKPHLKRNILGGSDDSWSR